LAHFHSSLDLARGAGNKKGVLQGKLLDDSILVFSGIIQQHILKQPMDPRRNHKYFRKSQQMNENEKELTRSCQDNFF
jgi:hypothetical protein